MAADEDRLDDLTRKDAPAGQQRTVERPAFLVDDFEPADQIARGGGEHLDRGAEPTEPRCLVVDVQEAAVAVLDRHAGRDALEDGGEVGRDRRGVGP
jgi:hypothetical protein